MTTTIRLLRLRVGIYIKSIGSFAARLQDYFRETRDWLADDLNGHRGLLVLRRNLELQIKQLWKDYQPIHVLDQGLSDYLNGFEDGDFRDEEVQDQQEYFDSSGYMDVLTDAMFLEAEIQYCIKDIDGLRRSPLIVVPPVNPLVKQNLGDILSTRMSSLKPNQEGWYSLSCPINLRIPHRKWRVPQLSRSQRSSRCWDGSTQR